MLDHIEFCQIVIEKLKFRYNDSKNIKIKII